MRDEFERYLACGILCRGFPVFHPLLQLDDSDLADLLQVIRVRLVNFHLRRGVMVLRPLLGVVEGRQELMLLNDDFAEREPEWNLQRSGRFQVGRRSSRKRGTREARSEPALAQLAAAAVAGLLPAGPDVRQRQPSVCTSCPMTLCGLSSNVPSVMATPRSG